MFYLKEVSNQIMHRMFAIAVLKDFRISFILKFFFFSIRKLIKGKDILRTY